MSTESLKPSEGFTLPGIDNLVARRIAEKVWVYEDERGEFFTLAEGGKLKGTSLAVKEGISLKKPGFLSRARDGWSLIITKGPLLSASYLFGQAQEGDVREIFVLDKTAGRVVSLTKRAREETISVLDNSQEKGVAIIPVNQRGERRGGVLIVEAEDLMIPQNVKIIKGF